MVNNLMSILAYKYGVVVENYNIINYLFIHKELVNEVSLFFHVNKDFNCVSL
jgi:hypothetical protein